jgi:hypothetical protein
MRKEPSTLPEIPKCLICPLCCQTDSERFMASNRKIYHRCAFCSLIYIDPSHLVDQSAEKRIYSLHQNSIEHTGYVNFLNRAILPSLKYINPSDVGLDYGCGPKPTLSRILRNQGITCYDYDPIFKFSDSWDIYDFIFATECFEHFHRPDRDIGKILLKLKSKGLLIVMTQLYSDMKLFPSWYYIQDPTHVSFYHLDTFDFIKNNWGLSLLYTDRSRVMIFCKE